MFGGLFWCLVWVFLLFVLFLVCVWLIVVVVGWCLVFELGFFGLLMDCVVSLGVCYLSVFGYFVMVEMCCVELCCYRDLFACAGCWVFVFCLIGYYSVWCGFDDG